MLKSQAALVNPGQECAWPRIAFDSSRDHSVLKISQAWTKAGLAWFGSRPSSELRDDVIGPKGDLTVGGFIGFNSMGDLVFKEEALFDNVTKSKLSSESEEGWEHPVGSAKAIV